MSTVWITVTSYYTLDSGCWNFTYLTLSGVSTTLTLLLITRALTASLRHCHTRWLKRWLLAIVSYKMPNISQDRHVECVIVSLITADCGVK